VPVYLCATYAQLSQMHVDEYIVTVANTTEFQKWSFVTWLALVDWCFCVLHKKHRL